MWVWHNWIETVSYIVFLASTCVLFVFPSCGFSRLGVRLLFYVITCTVWYDKFAMSKSNSIIIILTVTHKGETVWSWLAKQVPIFSGIKMANFYQQVLKPLVSYSQVLTIPRCPRLSLYYHHQCNVFFSNKFDRVIKKYWINLRLIQQAR